MNYEAAKKYIITRLEKELDPRLTYHSLSHTLDVLESAVRLADMEQLPETEKLLLMTACLYHDSGMLITYRGHEDASIMICREKLPEFEYSAEEISAVCRMINTTKLPQCANKPADKILCDADLDYLGRPDFFMISHKLKYEWDILNIHPTSLFEWYRIQKDFLSGHRYFTKSAKELRQEFKMQILSQIEFMCNHHK